MVILFNYIMTNYYSKLEYFDSTNKLNMNILNDINNNNNNNKKKKKKKKK